MENNEENTLSESTNVLYVYLTLQIAMFICAMFAASTTISGNNLNSDDYYDEDGVVFF